MSSVELLERRLAREKAARQQAESLLEAKSLELFEASENLRPLAERTQAILDHAAEGIFTIDADGVVVSFNPACERIFGVVADEIIGSSADLLQGDSEDLFEPTVVESDSELTEVQAETSERSEYGTTREGFAKRKDGTVCRISSRKVGWIGIPQRNGW